MATVFDTFQYIEGLVAAGIEKEKAEAITKATLKSLDDLIETGEVAFKEDIEQAKVEIIKYINDCMWKVISILASFQTVLLGLYTFLQHFAK